MILAFGTGRTGSSFFQVHATPASVYGLPWFENGVWLELTEVKTGTKDKYLLDQQYQQY